MTGLQERLLQKSTLDHTAILSESKLMANQDITSTSIPMINVALSGSVTGGFPSGLLMIAGQSKHFKTAFSLLIASAYLKRHKDAILLFYDSEFGSPQSYFKTFGIDNNRVVHCPVQDIETLKIDIVQQLEAIQKNDKVFILIDSIGNLASKKETDDAKDGKSVADMSRAKAFKSFFRLVTPYLTLRNLPMIAINHTYKEIGMYPKDIVSGGTGAYYSSSAVWIIGRQQEKDGKELQGFNFIINVEKSRFVKEKSKIPITVTFEEGIHKWSGLFENALEGNFITKSKVGWYQLVDQKTGELVGKSFRQDDVANDPEFWQNMFQTTEFSKFLETKYKLVLDDEKMETENV